MPCPAAAPLFRVSRLVWLPPRSPDCSSCPHAKAALPAPRHSQLSRTQAAAVSREGYSVWRGDINTLQRLAQGLAPAKALRRAKPTVRMQENLVAGVLARLCHLWITLALKHKSQLLSPEAGCPRPPASCPSGCSRSGETPTGLAVVGPSEVAGYHTRPELQGGSMLAVTRPS